MGIYQGKPNENTRKIVVEEVRTKDDHYAPPLISLTSSLRSPQGFLYDNDAYNDDLPYWDCNFPKPHLIVPYTLDNNDMRYNINNGFR